ncbi:MAG: efflux RND transporter permease subunit, partial [Rikenellaceae bacterium]
MNISKWALANSKLVYYFITILVVGGVLSYINMSKLEDPAITVKQAVIVTTYPGASSYEVELQVTDPLEKAIYTMKGVEKIDSRSTADLSIITINIDRTTPTGEIEQQWDILRRKISDAQSKLPEGANTSVVVDSYGDVFGMFYALSSDGYTNEELTDYADLIKKRVQRIKGISKIELFGVMSPTVDISIYEDRIAHLGISPTEVIQTIMGQNKSVYSGYFKSGEHRIRVSVNDKFTTPQELQNLIIQGHEGDQILLKDIARIERGYLEPTRNAMFFDRKPAIGISISALAGTDITKVGREVETLLDELKQTKLPAGVECHKVFYQPEKVENAINTFIINLLESIAIVVVVLMFAMGVRSGVLLGVTLLVTVLGSILFLGVFDGTLQRVSLASFILAMGMLVDNAIVIVDGILIDSKKGGLRSRYLTEIGSKTAMPLLGATLIAILAFLPIFLSPDTAGVYVRDLFIVLAVSLLLSWVLSLTMVPLMAKGILKTNTTQEIEKKKGWSQRALAAILNWALHNRTVAIASAIMMVVACGFVYRILPQSFFPDLAYNQLYIEYKLPEGVDPEFTRKDIDSLAKYLLSREDVTHVTTSVGATPSRYNLVRSIATPSMSYGDLIVEFVDEKVLVDGAAQIQQYINDNFPQAYSRVKRYNLMYNKYPLEVTFTGADPDVLRDLTRQAQEIMAGCDKITLITSDWEPKTPLLEVDYNQAVAREVGLSRQDVALSLLASTDGLPTSQIYDGTDSGTIVVKCVDSDGNRIDELESAPIFSLIPSTKALSGETLKGLMSGALSAEDVVASTLATIPLSQSINGIKIKWEDPVIVRYKGERSMRAQANNIPQVGAEDARKEIVDKIEAIKLPDGYFMKWQGEYES